ncbi:MAG TPA: hypothetical protein VJU87_05945, partial [Gemmatimonadaceae bacterium]|nr:hypothetical protein [Gemmatimonadaceae bacterium]
MLGALAAALVGALPAAAAAQIAPNAHWETLRTAHFYIHFTPPLEHMARRAAVSAEVAYGQLASELVPPRGPVDLVISDDADLSNGSATPFPTNRIVIYANPPVDESALRFTDDWTSMVITHELTHIFHLDRARGVWALAQTVFGRAPYIFPNEYAPSWLTEGLAVYYESRFTGAGRVAGSEHRMIARASAVDHDVPRLGDVSLSTPVFPFGEAAYAYGSLFIDYLARTRGSARVHDFVEKESAELIPYWLNLPARGGFGVSFSRAWRDWRDSLVRSIGPAAPTPLPGWRSLTRDGVFVAFPRWLGDTALVYSGTPGRETEGVYRVDLGGRRTRVGRRNSDSPQNPLPDGSLLYAQIDYTSPYQIRSDLYVQGPDRGERRLTHGARLTAPDRRGDGAIVAVQIIPAGTRLVRVSPDGRVITPITAGGLDEQWTEPRWSHRGDRIAAIRWRRGGISDVVVLDSSGGTPRVIVGGHAVQATPSWTADDDGLLYSSDRSGSAQLYLARFGAADSAGTGVREYRLTDVATGLFEPVLSP